MYLPDGAKLALNQLDETLEQSAIGVPTEIPDTEINRLRVGKVARLDHWRDKALSGAGTFRDTDNGTEYEKLKKAFNRAIVRLQKDKIIRVYGPYVWREWAPPSSSAGHSGTLRDTSGQEDISRSGHPGTSGVPLKGEPQTVPIDVPDDSPPPWLDEAPPPGPDDWRNNQILSSDVGPLGFDDHRDLAGDDP